MKTILVATDYSKTATNAVEYATLMAKETGAELILFNVFKPSIHVQNSLASSESLENMRKDNEERLHQLATEIASKHQIKVGWSLGKNDPVESLSKYTSENFVDVVVMGIDSNLTEYKLFGNTTTDAIKLMQFALLVVPNDIQYKGIKHIMYACESSYLEDGCKLSVLKEVVNDFKADLELLHVLTNGDDSGKKEELEGVMNSILQDVPHTYHYEVNPRVGDGIEAGLEASPSDLLVMIPHKMGFFEAFFKGSHTSQMSVKTRVPLLVIPNERAC